ncbi:uncharacterized protein LOC109598606 [Aethina tumida]|uniref:uncharacterized protein LOC109598606 n=1 Tax=Aethina tumida TaxID=116153 RepID=UPI00096B5B4C|nr:uncharacterized protein LOC109598606 [Aethina tumida]
MGSLLSSVFANFFMEKFEQKAIETSKHKPSVWYRYVDDTFVIWKHGQEKLDQFLKHLNSQHNIIEFTMELEKENQIPFLDVPVKRVGEHLDHTVYRKPTHTDGYLHKLFNHYPSQKQRLIERVKRICATHHLAEEQEYLKKTLQANR